MNMTYVFGGRVCGECDHPSHEYGCDAGVIWRSSIDGSPLVSGCKCKERAL